TGIGPINPGLSTLAKWRIMMRVQHWADPVTLLGTYDAPGDLMGNGTWSIQGASLPLFMQTGEYFIVRLFPQVALPVGGPVGPIVIKLSASAPSEVAVSSLSFASS